jgi:hypothetical protein
VQRNTLQERNFVLDDIATERTGGHRWTSAIREQRGLDAVARVLRRLLFAAGLLLGLAFAVACYAELLGIIHFE